MLNDLILVVDDEISILELTRVYIEKQGFKFISAVDGVTALKIIGERKPALVVLDVMLPEMDGFDVCRKLRMEENQIPIIMLTAREDDIDKILGLELGADDYLTKPFNPRELVARIKAVLRREESKNGSKKKIIHIGDLVIDVASREVKCGNKELNLRTQEFEVLRVLADHPGWVYSREKLLSQAWGFDFYGQTRTVDVHIAQLRRKLEGCQVEIETVTGVGYKLVI